jgi:dihydrofolate reductase
MQVAIVVAAADDNVIGKNNALPWRLPDDLKRFKSLTMGKPIIMGRKTFESIGKPLPGRQNIVISRQRDLEVDGCIVCESLDAALKATDSAPEVCVIGGAEIYRQALPLTDVIYLTRVHASVAGDVRFPALLPSEWRETSREEHAADDRHAHAFSFITLVKIR